MTPLGGTRPKDPDGSIEELSGDEYMQVVLADLHDRATEAQHEELRANVPALIEWRDALLELKLSVESKLGRIKAMLAEKRQATLGQGRQGERDYLSFEAAQEQERARLRGFKRLVEVRHREARMLIQEQGGASPNWGTSLEQIVTELRQITAHLTTLIGRADGSAR